jgi:hypothetical protein
MAGPIELLRSSKSLLEELDEYSTFFFSAFLSCLCLWLFLLRTAKDSQRNAGEDYQMRKLLARIRRFNKL